MFILYGLHIYDIYNPSFLFVIYNPFMYILTLAIEFFCVYCFVDAPRWGSEHIATRLPFAYPTWWSRSIWLLICSETFNQYILTSHILLVKTQSQLTHTYTNVPHASNIPHANIECWYLDFMFYISSISQLTIFCFLLNCFTLFNTMYLLRKLYYLPLVVDVH